MVIQAWMAFTQNQVFIYTKNVFVGLEFQFCISKFTPQDSFLCLVIHQYHIYSFLNTITLQFPNYSPTSVRLGSGKNYYLLK